MNDLHSEYVAYGLAAVGTAPDDVTISLLCAYRVMVLEVLGD